MLKLLSNYVIPTMHILQPKHSKLTDKESEQLLLDLNVSKAQLPKILSTDPTLPENCVLEDIIKIKRKEGDFFRVVV